MTKNLHNVLTRIPDGEWLAMLSTCGLQPMVRCALACIADSFNHLAGSTIVPNAAPLVNVINKWVDCPSSGHAQAAFEFRENAEVLAYRAAETSKEVGDWWSFEAVEEIGFLLVAIAQERGLLNRDHDFPDPPELLALHVCEYFLAFPYNVPRDKNQTLNEIRLNAMLPWFERKRMM